MIGQTLVNSLLLLWSSSSLYTATGMQYQDQKEQSWCNQNLSSVPVGLDLRLKGLNLSNNFIRHVNTLGLPYLQRLDLSYNQLDLISEGAFKNMAQLQELNLARNTLNNNVDSNSRAIESLHRLRSLDMSMNGLNDDAVGLYLRNKASLKHLELTGNGLTKLTSKLFTGSNSLRTINIENNLITDIEQGTFETLKKLETLNLARNNLVYICDFKLYQVKVLNLSRNSIEFFVTHEDGKLYKLEILDLSYNNLLYFPMVPKTNSLKYLHLQNNMLGALKTETLIAEANSLYKEITSEEDNAIENNNIYSNWRLMPLVYMDLSSNHFRSFPLETLSDLTSLETLNFSKNCLLDISYNATKEGQMHPQPLFLSLRYFDLQNNDIQHLSPVFLKALPKIETLNLQENSVRPCAILHPELGPSETVQQNISPNISCVSFRQIKTLRHLDLQENGITMLHSNTFEQTPLAYLNLARNVDMVMETGALEGLQNSLQSLSISGNNMTNSDLSLPCLTALNQLNVSNNNLNVLHDFISCSFLSEVDIRNNGFVSVDDYSLDHLTVHLDVLYISGNSFNCCNTSWLKILNKASVKIPDLDNAECTTNINGGMLLTDFLQNPSMHCLFDLNAKTPGLSLGQVVIIILFMITVLITLLVFARIICCQGSSFIV